MLNCFDWIRRTRSGAELLSTLKLISEEADLFSQKMEISSPCSALNSPCQRCWIFPRLKEDDDYCEICSAIISGVKGFGKISHHSAVIWAYTNRLPKQIKDSKWLNQNSIFALYNHDNNRFLLILHRRGLKDWLQELILYDGADLRGLIQIFPTVGPSSDFGMGEILCRAIHHEATFPMDQLRIRFYSVAYSILRSQLLDHKGVSTFEITDFLNMMSTAVVFRALLRPDEQKALYDLLNINRTTEQKFHWGRFQGNLNKDARDMLNAWKIMRWPKDKVNLLYQLIDYVELYQIR